MSDTGAVVLTPILLFVGMVGPRSGHLIETMPTPVYFVVLGVVLLVLGVVAIAIVLAALKLFDAAMERLR